MPGDGRAGGASRTGEPAPGAPALGLVLVHGWAPPTPGGTAVVVDRLLGRMENLRITTWTRAGQRRRVRLGDFVLPGAYRFFPKLRAMPSAPAALQWPITLINCALAVLTGLRIGAGLHLKGNYVVLSVADEGFSQIAGAVAAKVGRVPHVIWVFDVWEENAYAASDRVVARYAEGRLWRSAAAVIVHAEEMVEHYRSKHGVVGRLLRTPIDARTPVPARPPRADRWEVLVAGSVYWAQAEALARVAAAVRAIPGAVLTVIGDRRLQAQLLDGARYEPPLHGQALHERLAAAQLLVLGLSFDSDHMAVIQTATPARFPEYLLSGVPVLVHAPATSHVAHYARRWDIATVVDTPDTGAVRTAIEQIRGREDEARKRAERACDLVLARHSATTIAKDFRGFLQQVAATRAVRP